jgi:hypothetical protein
MSIEMVKCRATVSIGGVTVSTPYVQSFNVRKQRGQVSTFDASLKVNGASIGSSLTGGAVVISAGTDGSKKTIFTGICRQAKVSPCFDDPAYVILSISGADALSLLHGKKYTRRCRETLAAWVGITGVVREGLRSGKFAYSNEPTITTDGGKTESKITTYGLPGITTIGPNKVSGTTTNEDSSPVHLSVVVLSDSPVIPPSE